MWTFIFENHSFNPISKNLECRLSRGRQSKLLHRRSKCNYSDLILVNKLQVRFCAGEGCGRYWAGWTPSCWRNKVINHVMTYTIGGSLLNHGYLLWVAYTVALLFSSNLIELYRFANAKRYVHSDSYLFVSNKKTNVPAILHDYGNEPRNASVLI
jgi:hypothetical protein